MDNCKQAKEYKKFIQVENTGNEIIESAEKDL